jgi:hypothetical protein
MTKMVQKINCKTCGGYFADLLLDASFAAKVRAAGAHGPFSDAVSDAVPVPVSRSVPDLATQVAEHLADCAACRAGLEQMRATFALMDSWEAPEPSAFFDGRLHARLRQAQAEQPEGLWSRVRSFFLYSSRRRLRPVLAGALALMVIAGSEGGFMGLHGHHRTAAMKISPAVKDLKILDTNAQALQQMDQLLDSDDGSSAPPLS